MSGKQKKTLRQKLHNKYCIVIYNNDTYEEKKNFKLNCINVFNIILSYSIFLILLTTFLIAFTPLKKYIPGYNNAGLKKRIYKMECKVDSLEIVFRQKDLYINNLNKIMISEDFSKDSINTLPVKTNKIDFNKIEINNSEQDSLFRIQFETETKNNLFDNRSSNIMPDIRHDNKLSPFFVPLNGIITNHFNINEKHYGTDIVAPNDAVIKATADGSVIYADWNINNGYTIGIQHKDNLFSVYKHNTILLKKEGDFVNAGDVIAIIGNSGNLSTGPHLHFELWFNGIPLNPEEYISFESN